ncbi:MAG: hypothetical protein AUK47_03310 [Deltaproteobacteria bacterium CG2_30_63_29]|nr:MAG: hypothetical protein AUK47_03310 [Deltaproteobacteria bacterium CG2_30_63_29]
MHVAWLIGLLALLVPVASWSQETSDRWPMSEVEALRLVLGEHPRLAGPQKGVDAAQRSVDGSDATQPWLFSASAEYTHQDRPIRDAFSRGMQIQDSFVWSVAFAKTWEFGLELVLALDNTVSRSETPLVLALNGAEVKQRRLTGPFNFSVLSASLTQHLLKGASQVVNSLPQQRAELELSAAQLEVARQRNQVLYEALTAYWELQRAEAALELRRKSVGYVRQQQEIVDELIDAGTTARIEADFVEQQLVTAQDAVALAELSRDLRELELRQALALPADEQMKILPTTPMSVPAKRQETLEDMTTEVIETSQDLQAARQRLAMQELEVIRSAEETEPTLDLTARIAQQGLDDQLGLSDGFMLDAYRQIALIEFGAVSFGAIFSMPLDNDYAEAAAESAEIEYTKVEAEVKLLENQTALRVASSYRTLDSTHSRLALLDKSVDLAKRNLETGQERYAAGHIASLELMRLQEELEGAEVQRLNTQIDLVLRDLELDSLSGRLLERFGVVEP